MKNKIFLFLGLLILSAGFFFSCEDDLSQEKITTQNTKTFNNLTSRKISGNALLPIIDKLNKTLNLNPKKNSLITTFSSDYNIENVDLSEAIMVENELNQISYSFKIDQNEIQPSTIENLVLIDRNGQYELAKFSYTMSDDFAQDYYSDTKTLIDFEGTLQIVTLSGDCCTVNQAPINIGGNTNGGDGSSSGSNDGGSYDGGGSNGGATGGWGLGYAGGSGSSGGGSSSNDSGSSVQMCQSGMHVRGDSRCIYTAANNSTIVSNRISSPSTGEQPNTTPDRELCCIYNVGLFSDLDDFNALFIQNLNPQQLNWWNNANPDTKNDILNFIYPNNISEQSIQFAMELIDLVFEHNIEIIDTYQGNYSVFNNLSEVEDFLTYEEIDNTISNSNNFEQDKKITNRTIKLNSIVDLNIELVTKPNPNFSIDEENCNTDITTFLPGVDWVQQSIIITNSNLNGDNNNAEINISGYILVGIEIGDYKKGLKHKKHIILRVNKNTGQIYYSEVKDIN